VRVFRKTTDHIRILSIQGDDGNIETIRTTDSHPFFVQGKGWTSAGELEAGDQMQEADGTWQTLLSSIREAHPEGIVVYNLEVAGDHTYFVEDGSGTADAVWVHNVCRDPQAAFAITVKYPNTARSDLRAALIAEFGEAAMGGKAAHHVIPIDAIKEYDVIRVIMKASKAGFNFNGTGNGHILPDNHGPHQAYTDDIVTAIRSRIGEVTSDASARDVLESVINRAKTEFIPQYWPGY
jgi:hypothetical protein